VQAIQRALQEPENQFHLPTVSVQQDDLEGGQVQPIGQNQVPFLAHEERDQTIYRLILGVAQTHTLIRDMEKDVLHRGWQVNRHAFHPLVHQVGLGADDEKGLCSHNGRQERKTEIPSIGDVGHTGFQHVEQCLLLVRLACIDQEVGRDHAVELETQMETNRLMATRVLSPQHRGYENPRTKARLTPITKPSSLKCVASSNSSAWRSEPIDQAVIHADSLSAYVFRFTCPTTGVCGCAGYPSLQWAHRPQVVCQRIAVVLCASAVLAAAEAAREAIKGYESAHRSVVHLTTVKCGATMEACRLKMCRIESVFEEWCQSPRWRRAARRSASTTGSVCPERNRTMPPPDVHT